MTKPKTDFRLVSVRYGTVLRVIRPVKYERDKYGVAFHCRDETFGGLCWLPMERVTDGDWVIYEPDTPEN